VSGATVIDNTLDVSGNMRVHTDKFVVTATSGNTAIAGTLDVVGNAIISGATITNKLFGTSINDPVTFSHKDRANATDYALWHHQNGYTRLNANTDRDIRFCINNQAKMFLDKDGNFGIGNGTITPTAKLEVTGSTKLDGILDVVGDTTMTTTAISSTLDVSGATVIDNTLDVSGNMRVHTDKFVVTATSGNTAIAGTLGVVGVGRFTNDTESLSTGNGAVVVTGGVGIAKNANIGGNLVVTGDLTVNGTTTTISTTNLDVSDNMIMLSKGTTTATSDAGILIERGGVFENAFMGWDHSESRFIMGTTSANSDATGDLSIAKAQLEADLVGDVITSTQNSITTMTGLSAIGKADTNTTFSGPIVAGKGATFTNNEIIDFSAARPIGIWNGSVNTNDGGTVVLDVDNAGGAILHADLDGTVTTAEQNSITTMTGLTAVGTAGTPTIFSGPIEVAAAGSFTSITSTGNVTMTGKFIKQF